MLLFLFCLFGAARTADVGEMEDNYDDAGDDTDDDRNNDGEDKISGVSVRIQVGDGQTGVGPGVVTGDDGVIHTRDIVPGLTDNLWRIATAPDVHHQHCHHRLVGG